MSLRPDNEWLPSAGTMRRKATGPMIVEQHPVSGRPMAKRPREDRSEPRGNRRGQYSARYADELTVSAIMRLSMP